MLIELTKKHESIIREYLSCVISLCIYSVLVVFLYIKWIVPSYEYFGYTASFNLINAIVSFIYLGILSCFLVIQTDNIKALYVLMIILQVVIPMLCLYTFAEKFVIFDLYMFMSFSCVIVVSIVGSVRISYITNLSNVSFNNLFLPLLTIVILFTLARYIVLNGLSVFNLDITKVYDYRLLLRESMTGILAYLDSWTVKVINPFCIVYSLYRKNKSLVVFYVTLQVLLFGFSSHKSVLFSALILVCFFYITPFFQRRKWFIIWIFIVACFAPLLLYFKEISGMWSSIFRRVFFVPATLNFYYYEYFSMNSFDWFRQSFLRHFVSSNYDLLLPRIIGLEYFGNMETNANTGFLGAGYAQGGFLVMIVYSVIIGMLINVIAAFCKKLPPGLAVGITILPMSSLFTSGDLPSSLVTGGLLIALFLLYIMSRDPTISTID